MSVTRMRRRFEVLRDRLREAHASLDVAEEVCLRKRDDLVRDLDEILRVLQGMLEVHEGHSALSAAIRERMDSTLDERLRLMAMEGGAR